MGGSQARAPEKVARAERPGSCRGDGAPGVDLSVGGTGQAWVQGTCGRPLPSQSRSSGPGSTERGPRVQWGCRAPLPWQGGWGAGRRGGCAHGGVAGGGDAHGRGGRCRSCWGLAVTGTCPHSTCSLSVVDACVFLTHHLPGRVTRWGSLSRTVKGSTPGHCPRLLPGSPTSSADTPTSWHGAGCPTPFL